MNKSKFLMPGYCLIMYLFWSGYCATSGYTSYYLLDRGLSNSAIGMVIALACLTAAVLEPTIASLADSENSPNLKFFLCVIVGAVLILLLALNMTFGCSSVLIAVLYAGTIIVLHLLNPLINSLGTTAINQGEKLNFSFARAIGSGAYAVAAFILGRLTAFSGSRSLLIVTFLIYFLLGVSILIFPFRQDKSLRSGSGNKQKDKSDPLSFFRRYPAYAIVIAGALLIHIGQTTVSSFFYQIVVSKGGDSAALGVAQCIGAAAELPVMFGFAWLLKKAPASRWLVVSCFGYILRFILLNLATSCYGVWLAQSTQLICWGLAQVAYVYYVNAIMKDTDAVKGQAYFAMTITLGTTIGSSVGGVLVDRCGISIIPQLSLLLSIAGTFLLTLGVRRGSRN